MLSHTDQSPAVALHGRRCVAQHTHTHPPGSEPGDQAEWHTARRTVPLDTKAMHAVSESRAKGLGTRRSARKRKLCQRYSHITPHKTVSGTPTPRTRQSVVLPHHAQDSLRHSHRSWWTACSVAGEELRQLMAKQNHTRHTPRFESKYSRRAQLCDREKVRSI